jgi:subtilisin family serine protease
VFRTKIAVVDSGINPQHPHIGRIAGGISFSHQKDGSCDPADFLDRLGHGTAVAGAICEKAPSADIYAVKVFDRSPATSSTNLLAALAWCLDEHMHFINLSLGTVNPAYAGAFTKLVARAVKHNITIVAAYEMNGEPAYPGSLAGVIGVLMDNTCRRDEARVCERDGRKVWLAAGYPRSIPGVPPERNLYGISFAVANVTGILAANASCEQIDPLLQDV